MNANYDDGSNGESAPDHRHDPRDAAAVVVNGTDFGEVGIAWWPSEVRRMLACLFADIDDACSEDERTLRETLAEYGIDLDAIRFDGRVRLAWTRTLARDEPRGGGG